MGAGLQLARPALADIITSSGTSPMCIAPRLLALGLAGSPQPVFHVTKAGLNIGPGGIGMIRELGDKYVDVHYHPALSIARWSSA